LFRVGRSPRIGNGMVGKIDDIDVKIFEYSFAEDKGIGAYPDGGGSVTTTAHVVLVENKNVYFPEFKLSTKKAFQEILFNYKGQKNISFDSHPQLASYYSLIGKDEDSIRRLFNIEILYYLDNQKDRMSVEAFGDKLIYYRASHLEPEEILNLYKKGLELYKLFESSVLKNA